jgi:hypothetical protein
MDPITQAIIAGMKSGKFGDLSSATMDPVLSYLMGTYQPAPKFDENQLWERFAPNTLLAMAGQPGDPFTDAAIQIREGTPAWQLYDQKPKSVKKEKTWNNFIDSISKEQDTVRAKLMEQSLVQDPFQKAGLPGAEQKYTLQDMYKYAPSAFGNILKDVDKNLKRETLKNRNIDARYGDVMLTSDADKKKFLRARAIEDELGKQRLDKRDQSSRNIFQRLLNAKIQMPGAPKGRAESKAKKDFNALGGAAIKDEAASARNRAYAEYLKPLIGNRPGNATRQLTDAEKLGALIQSKLESQGQTPLKDALAMAVLYKNKMKNG